MHGILLGSPESDHVRADVHGRRHPDALDSDGNWLDVEIDVRVRPFAGTYRATWWAGFLRRFREELEALYDSLEGEATLHPDWERSLTLTLAGDGNGHLRVTGTACPDGGGQGPELRFELAGIDQTYLPDLIAAVRDIEATFPPTT